MPGQAEIAAVFAFGTPADVAISACTRYGKTYSAGVGLAVRTVIDPRPLKLPLIGPTQDQARLLRNEFVGALFQSPLARRLLGLKRDAEERMRRRLQHDAWDFRDGKTAAVMSVSDEADRVMGFGGDVITCDEHALWDATAWAKVLRMAGDNPSGAQVVCMSNPWDESSPFGEVWKDTTFQRIHIDWERCLAEGPRPPGVRGGVTREFIDKQRRRLPAVLFRIFYDSDFPDAAEDQLLSSARIARAIRPDPWSSAPPRPLELGPAAPPATRWGLDVARGGGDFSVLTQSLTDGFRWHVRQQWRWDVNDLEDLADVVHATLSGHSEIAVDANSLGAGVADNLRRRGHSVHAVNVGEGPTNPNPQPGDVQFMNLKAELWWNVRTLLEEDRLTIQPDLEDLRDLGDQLRIMRWVVVGKRIKVEEKQGAKSPDYGDSLMLSVAPPRAGRRRRLLSG